MFLAFAASRKFFMFSSCSPWSFRENCFEIIFFNKLSHFPLKTSYSVSDTKGETSKLIEFATSFKGCVRFVFILEWYLMGMRFKDE